MRTDLTTEVDSALAGRNAGSKGYWEVARSGNGNMMTDLLAEDGQEYDELEGMGESVEEMDGNESRAEDAGNKNALVPFCLPRPGENPPYPPRQGRQWIKRRMRMNSRRPGGNRLIRTRWVQVTPEKLNEIKNKGLLKGQMTSQLAGMGFFDVSRDMVTGVFIGGGIAAAIWYAKRRGILKI